jgi:hypothetical protein
MLKLDVRLVQFGSSGRKSNSTPRTDTMHAIGSVLAVWAIPVAACAVPAAADVMQAPFSDSQSLKALFCFVSV